MNPSQVLDLPFPEAMYRLGILDLPLSEYSLGERGTVGRLSDHARRQARVGTILTLRDFVRMSDTELLEIRDIKALRIRHWRGLCRRLKLDPREGGGDG